MTRKLCLWILVILVPVINLRMICVDHPAGVSAGAVVPTPPDCDDICPREASPRPQEESSGNGCLLVAGGCSALATFIAALAAPAPAGIPAPSVAPYLEPTAAHTYRGPSAPPFSPPPEL